MTQTSERGPTEAQVRRHAVTEGIVVGVAIGGGVAVLGADVAENIVGESKVDRMMNDDQYAADHAGDVLILVSPVIVGTLATIGIYKYLSRRIRRNNGSSYIGYRTQDETPEG